MTNWLPVVALLALSAAAAGASEPGCDLAPSLDAGWTDLSRTEQWSAGIGLPFPAAAWKREGACLILEKPGGTSIFTKDSSGDFELAFDWRLASGGNSGVKYMGVAGRIHPDFYRIFVRGILITAATILLVLLVQLWALKKRVSILGTRWGFRVGVAIAGLTGLMLVTSMLYLGLGFRQVRQYPTGVEYQIVDDANNPDAKEKPSHRTAALYDMLPAQGVQLKPEGEFNQSRIVVRGGRAEHWLNGVKVLEYEFGSRALKDALAQSKFAGLPDMAEKSPGHLELQDHGARVVFRGLKLRRLE